MLNAEDLKNFTEKFQTSNRNVVREYIQSMFLSALYKIEGSGKLLFKGGTALRLVYQSPRFSEDLDFTGQRIYRTEEIDDLFIAAMAEVEKAGTAISFKEAKPTTGGYLGLIHYEANDQVEDMKFEVSLRKGGALQGEVMTVSSDYVPAFSLVQVPPRDLVAGKMAALLNRQKARDYYDLYFILRHRELNKYADKKKMNLVVAKLKTIRTDFKKELMVFLPASHQLLLKDFKKTLMREIEKYL